MDAPATSTAAVADDSNLGRGQGIAPTNKIWTPEKHVDMVTCINNLTKQECRQLILNLDDMYIRDLIKHHVHSYGNHKWANGIQVAFVNQVKTVNKDVARFDYIEDMIKNQFKYWDQHSLSKQHGDLGTDVYQDFESHVRMKLWPSINHIGVVCTYSDYIQTKRNGLTNLVNIGELILNMGIFTKDPKGREIFACYDGLSRAVANILHSAADLQVRHQILDHGIQQALEHLQARGEAAGLFTNLGKAMLAELGPCPYELPDTTSEEPPLFPLPQPLQQPAPKRKARGGEGKKSTKRTKKNTQAQNKDSTNTDHLIDPQLLGGPTTSRALEASSSEQQRVVDKGGFYTLPDETDNPFAPPFTATGSFPVAPAGAATTSGSPVDGGRGITPQGTGHREASQAAQTPVRTHKGPVAKYVVTPQEVERYQAQEKDALGLYDDEDVKVARQLLDLQYLMQQEEEAATQQLQQEAQQYLPVAEETAPTQQLQLADQADQQHEAAQQNAPVAVMMVTAQEVQEEDVQPLRDQEIAPQFTEELNNIHHLMMYEHANKSTQRQMAQAPFLCKSIEGSCLIILNTTRTIADAHKGGDEYLYMTQYNALQALLWILHACAIDTLGTPLSGEVSKQLRREPLTMALWSCAKPLNGNPDFMNRLFNDTGPDNGVPLGAKLHAIIISLQKTGVKGYERLKYILDEMSGPIDTNQVAALI